MTPIAPSAAELATPQAARTWQTAKNFETMALSEMLAPMFKTVDLSTGPFGGGEGEQAFQPFLIEAIAKQMVARGGLGLAMPVFHQMLRLQEARENPP
jgi:Rod binding domain-containing protein